MDNAIIFDADGVVIQSEMYFSQRFSRDFGVPLEKILPFYKKEFQLCLTGKADLKTEINKYLSDWSWDKSIDELLDYWFRNESLLNKELLASITDLRKKGVKCYLATNNEKYRVEYLKNNLELSDQFDQIFASCELGFLKPSQDFWQLVSEGIDIRKENILVLDDNKENVTSAKAFGFNAELYSDYKTYQRLINNWE